MVIRIEKISGINNKMRKKNQQEREAYKEKLKKTSKNKPKFEKSEKRNKYKGKIDVVI